MRKSIRVLSMVFTFRSGQPNLRYKIAYHRNIYNGDDIQNGDILDQVIYDFFKALNPKQIGWELIQLDMGQDLNHLFVGFNSRNIPLIISANLNGLNTIEIQNLADADITFTNQHRELTLFCRKIMDENDYYKPLLPDEVRVSLLNNLYVQKAQTIHSYL